VSTEISSRHGARSARSSSKSTTANVSTPHSAIDRPRSSRQTCRRMELLRSSSMPQYQSQPVPSFRVSRQGCSPVLCPRNRRQVLCRRNSTRNSRFGAAEGGARISIVSLEFTVIQRRPRPDLPGTHARQVVVTPPEECRSSIYEGTRDQQRPALGASVAALMHKKKAPPLGEPLRRYML
jgi:hypothetical protein